MDVLIALLVYSTYTYIKWCSLTSIQLRPAKPAHLTNSITSFENSAPLNTVSLCSMKFGEHVDHEVMQKIIIIIINKGMSQKAMPTKDTGSLVLKWPFCSNFARGSSKTPPVNFVQLRPNLAPVHKTDRYSSSEFQNILFQWTMPERFADSSVGHLRRLKKWSDSSFTEQHEIC